MNEKRHSMNFRLPKEDLTFMNFVRNFSHLRLFSTYVMYIHGSLLRTLRRNDTHQGLRWDIKTEGAGTEICPKIWKIRKMPSQRSSKSVGAFLKSGDVAAPMLTRALFIHC